MQMNPHEIGASERGARTDPEVLARVQAIETVLPTLATRAQLEQLRGEMKEGFGVARAELKQDIGALRSEMKEDIGALRSEMKEDIGALRSEMKEGFGAVRAELQKTSGDRHLESQGMIFSVMKWSIGFTLSCAMLVATLVATVAPLWHR
jgi:hypothetical protein